MQRSVAKRADAVAASQGMPDGRVHRNVDVVRGWVWSALSGRDLGRPITA